MPRTPTAFADAELLAITRALQQLDVAHADNRAFLRRAFDAIDRICGRSFGASIYRRLLVAAGIARMPSGQTVAAVIAERKTQPTSMIEAERSTLLNDGLRGFLHKEIRVALDETVTSASRRSAVAIPQRVAEEGEKVAENAASGTLTALLTQRMSMLEEENRGLRERAVAAEAVASRAQAEAQVAQAALAQKETSVLTALLGITEELAQMGERQAAADRRRALETDNVRQAYRAERDALAGRVAILEDELKTARAGADAYRQALQAKR